MQAWDPSTEGGAEAENHTQGQGQAELTLSPPITPFGESI